MKIMSVNAGSSSLKFQLLNMKNEEVLCDGLFERIGNTNTIFKIKTPGHKQEQIVPISDHKQAVEMLLEYLIEKKFIQTLDEIDGVGHRIVQGGEYFKNSVVLTEENIKQVESLNDLAPLHNPANLLSIKVFKKVLPQTLQVGVFDTNFHQTMQEQNFLYATPYEWYQKYKIRKYGFHGISYQYISQKAQEIFQKPNLKLIVCHAGNGVSLTAIENGKSVDTSMGFTPLEGVPMGTRSGNVDPNVVTFIADKENKTAKEVINELNKKSGLLGVSGISNDGRDLENMIQKNNKRALLAFEIQIKRVVDYIASYYVLLKGADALIFTAGIGENSSFFRREVVKRLEALNIYLDQDLNDQRLPGERVISTSESAVKVMVIPTNEEIAIARDVVALKQQN
ncbi:acetate kinase [Candidatus Phytoplasma pruni]|nr:acetate kinase [Candidatus Phytoplasma pruni]